MIHSAVSAADQSSSGESSFCTNQLPVSTFSRLRRGQSINNELIYKAMQLISLSVSRHIWVYLTIRFYTNVHFYNPIRQLSKLYISLKSPDGLVLWKEEAQSIILLVITSLLTRQTRWQFANALFPCRALALSNKCFDHPDRTDGSKVSAHTASLATLIRL